MAALAQQPRGVDRGGDGERVDDARARQVVEVAEQPGEAGRGVGQAQHAEPQRRAGERPADGDDVDASLAVAAVGAVPSCSATSATTRLFAVAVVASTGTPGGIRAMRSRSRR